MAFDWEQYLLLARQLAEKGNEASLRAAMSRAYYAAFHKARQHQGGHIGTYETDPNAGSHDVVWRYYWNHRNPNYRRIGEWASRLKAARVVADYREDALISPQKAKDTCDIASRIINRLAHL